MQGLNYKQQALLLLLFSTLLRIFLAANIEFGNDEVYYWLYAKYPAISHFDHPPMVGFLIQLFTINLHFNSELCIRLAAIIPSSISMYVLFLIASYLKNEKAGFIAVLLYNIHIYSFVVVGTFILPDAPLVLFWLLSFYYFIQTIPEFSNKKLNLKLMLGFLFAGCAIYSKYQAVYLLLGVGLYVLLFNRSWLKNTFFYLGFVFPLIAVALIFYWNYDNDFISYKFHGNRVSLFSFKFNKNSFIREILGQFLYNNPYIVIMVIFVISSFFKKKFIFNKKQTYLILTCALPLIVTTIYLSLFRDTLPHWSGVSYITLLPLLSVYLITKKQITKKLLVGVASFTVLLLLAVPVINKGWFLPVVEINDIKKLGKKDVLLDMYGWEQASEKITKILEAKEIKKLPIISNRWYPAAHIDYYIARPNNMTVYGVGSLKDIHKYYWINKKNPPLQKEVLYITDSRNYKDPKKLYGKEYTIELVDTIPIKRAKNTVKYVFLYKLSKG